jgi:hypothetical protein
VSEPVYCRISEEAILAVTSEKSMPAGITTFVPGERMAGREDESDFIIEEDGFVETWKRRDMTASWVGLAIDACVSVLYGTRRRREG